MSPIYSPDNYPPDHQSDQQILNLEQRQQATIFARNITVVTAISSPEQVHVSQYGRAWGPGYEIVITRPSLPAKFWSLAFFGLFKTRVWLISILKVWQPWL